MLGEYKGWRLSGSFAGGVRLREGVSAGKLSGQSQDITETFETAKSLSKICFYSLWLPKKEAVSNTEL